MAVLPFKHVVLDVDFEAASAIVADGSKRLFERLYDTIQDEGTKPGAPRRQLIVKVLPTAALLELLAEEHAFVLEVTEVPSS